MSFFTASLPLWQNKKLALFAALERKSAIFCLFTACLKNQHSARKTTPTVEFETLPSGGFLILE
ncbi:MAG: hypothetical protein IKW63_03600 [Elusimicrobiaceae bacterium]|nr:hypothetical protein [Elusimicrobiaceae bacterium]